MNRKERIRIHRRATVVPGHAKSRAKSSPGQAGGPAPHVFAPRPQLASLSRNEHLLRKSWLSGPAYSGKNTGLTKQLRQEYGSLAVQRLVTHVDSARVRGIQTRLIVGAAGDRYEREADRVARAVVAFLNTVRARPEQVTKRGERSIHRRSADGMRVFAEGGVVDRDIERSIRYARGGGRSMPRSLRADVERAFGADFSSVRIHTGTVPDRLNRYLGAAAFTLGTDIFFRRGYYRPGVDRGLEILAHELTHVMQQRRG